MKEIKILIIYFLSSLSLISYSQDFLEGNIKEDNNESALEEFRYSSKIFGHDYLNNFKEKEENLKQGPLPPSYAISAGDTIVLNFTGERESLYTLEVFMDGSVAIPGIGTVNIANLTIEEAQKIISNLVLSVFSGTRVSLAVQKSGLISVSIIGAVKNTGSYLLSPYSTVADALISAGGIYENSSIRSVKIMRGNIDFEVDLYEYLITGKNHTKSFLRSGDVVLVSSTDRFVEINGAVHQPKIFEFKEDESIKDLVSYAGGYKTQSDKDNISISYYDLNQSAIKYKSANENETFKNLREIYIPERQVSDEKSIFVMGKVSNSGYISSDFDYLSDVINSMSFSEAIYPYFALLKQYDEKLFSYSLHTFSLSDPDTYQDISLKDDVEITFFSRDDFNDIQSYFIGLKNREDNYNEYALLNEENIRLQEQIDFLINQENKSQNLIDLLKEEQKEIEEKLFFNLQESLGKDSLNISKDYLSGEIYEILKNNSINIVLGENNFLFPMAGRFNVKLVLDYLDVDKSSYDLNNIVYQTLIFGAQKLDIQNLKTFNFERNSSLNIAMKASELISVSIDGNIKNPGTYKVSRGTPLQELYIIAGGLLDGASERGILVQRKSLQEREVKSLKDARRIIINSLIASGNDGSDQAISFLNLLDQEVEEEFLGRISGDFSFGSKGANSLVLSEEDKIFIPNFTNTVSVLGEVLTPTSFIFEERKNINFYINQSGGFSNIADKGKIYIVGADGVSSSAQLTLFNRGYSPQPGDIIIVPKKLNRFQLTPVIAAATQILSNLAFASASLNAIQNQ